MERKHQHILKQNFPGVIAAKTIIVLDIADDYQFNDPELVATLKTSLISYL
jgi:predicted protein tyrosine phosphatase